MLRPLEQWICDGCGELVESPEHAYLEWVRDKDMNVHDFRICHHKPHSPLAGENGCYSHAGKLGRSDVSLRSRYGHKALPFLFRFLNGGHLHDSEGNAVRIDDMKDFLEMARRLTIPYYEEARQYWSIASHELEFQGMNDEAIYSPDFLQEIIERYSEGEHA